MSGFGAHTPGWCLYGRVHRGAMYLPGGHLAKSNDKLLQREKSVVRVSTC